MYALYFSQVGVQIVTANDGQAALAAVKEQRPDIVVLDLAMPGLSGWDVLRLLRSDLETRDIPVLVLSGQRAREDALRSGADGYCEKPCLPDRLFGEIIRVLHGGH
jgi:CheY-like chemotaxis protein